VVAALTGALVGIGVALAWVPAAGIVAGGLIGPAIGLLFPDSHHEAALGTT
jgi:hypothetical protein